MRALARLLRLSPEKVEIRDLTRYYRFDNHSCFPRNAGSARAKYVIVDHARAYVGSADITSNGLMTNYEVGVAFNDRGAIHSIMTQLEPVLRKGSLITIEWIQKFVAGIGIEPTTTRL